MIHIPVLRDTVLEVLAPKAGESVLDVTLGLGGHSEAFLKATGPDGPLTALDADAQNLAFARKRLEPFGDRVDLKHVNFGQLPSLELEPFDVIFADLGLSSPHLDDASRGFSFRFEGPLDLRFDRTRGRTAAEFIKNAEEEELTRIFRSYGELHKEGSRLGRTLAGKDIPTTTALREAVEAAFGFRAKPLLAQIFQALRIAVNDELEVLRVFLETAPGLLKPGGRLGVLSYHSLEDRMVKQTFRALCEHQKDPITGKVAVHADYEPLTKKAIQASDEEIIQNPRARSVKFRAIRRASR